MQFAALYHPSKLIVIGTRNGRLDFARKLGATHTVNIRETEPVDAVMDITGGHGADRIINCATTDSAFELALNITAKNAVIVAEGLSGSGNTLPIRMDDFIKPISIVGVCGVLSGQFNKCINFVRDKRVDIQSLITHRFPLTRIGEALRVMHEERDAAMKVMLFPHEN